VFIISGFWHGANYTFLIWGGIHGLLYLIERVSQSVAKRLFALSNPSPLAQILCSALKFLPGTEGKSTLANKLVRGLLIFVAVNLAWVFFRIDSMDQVGTHFTALWSSAGTQTLDLTWVLATLMIVFIVFDIALYNNRIDGFLEKFPLAIRWSVYGILLWCIWAWAGMANHPFIYFQF
jgi:D-alanyl-lipoteichoic acid acyltransferase DltB (MBOAT superfamily)